MLKKPLVVAPEWRNPITTTGLEERCLYVPLSVAKLVAGKARRDGTKVIKGVQNGWGIVNQQLRIARGNS